MRILVPGLTDRQHGFTLLEMMIVLLIIGIGTAMASVSAFGDNNARALRQDARRLAQLFTVAQAEAIASGRTIVWEHTAKGYRFVRLPRQLILPARLAARASLAADASMAQDSALRPRKWISAEPVDVRVNAAGNVIFGADWIPGPLELKLSAGAEAVRVARLGSGRFVVNP
ncbi:type II secretion system minor pseudopilin GspH [Alcaligenaceae bacterium]|nr:type II secretion system minor pseudopilin GspH [Alcaligenaceae bacterium]